MRTLRGWLLRVLCLVGAYMAGSYFSASAPSRLPQLSSVRASGAAAPAPVPAAAAAPVLRLDSGGDSLAACPSPPAQRLWAVGLATGTDKFRNAAGRGHHYQSLYEAFLGPLHCHALNILEIGLGCNAGIAEAGQSLAMWLHYFPLATATVFEYDGSCVDAWVAADPMGIGREALARRVTWVKGDQSKVADLQPLLARGPFDFVLDDGGHSFSQQIVSLVTLLPAVRPGGMYILEDLGTSYSNPEHPVAKPWNDWPVSAAAYVAKVLAAKHMPASMAPVYFAEEVDARLFPGVAEVAARTNYIACAQETCIFTVWREGEAAAQPPLPAQGVPHHKPAGG
jgi:hypothetical protein